MLDIITNNPFRILGVFSNTSKKEIIAQKGKISAFARIGKSIPQDTDFHSVLQPLSRTVEMLSEAEGKLTLPNDIVKYSLFWFICHSSLDKTCITQVRAGSIDAAIESWKRIHSFSSLQNRIVCYLIKEDYTNAFACAEELYTSHASVLLGCIMSSELMTFTKEDVMHMFCDYMYEAKVINDAGWMKIDNILESSILRDYIKQIRSTTHIRAINEFLDKYTGGSSPNDNLEAAKNLKEKTKSAVDGLQKVYDKTSPIFQTTMDKLSNAILSKTIAYYNQSTDADCAVKALPLMEYASTLAVGEQQVNRCKTNTKTIKDDADRYNNPTPVTFEKPVYSNTTSIYASNQFKSFIKPFLKVGGVLLGETTRSMARLLGYNDVRITDSDSYGAIIKGVKAFDINSTGKYNSFTFNRYDLDEEIKKFLNVKKTYYDWKLFFESEGFLIEELEAPSIYKQTLNFFCAKFRASSIKLNLIIDLEFFSITYKDYASSFEPFDLSKVSVLTLTNQPKPFLDWFPSISSNYQYSTIYGDKSLQQLIQNPLGDSSLDPNRMSYNSVSSWIKSKGVIRDYGKDLQMCSFVDPPTTYRNKRIKDMMFSEIPSLFNSMFLYFEFDYFGGLKNKATDVEEVIKFCEQIKSDMTSLGYYPVGGRKFDDKIKFETKGSKGKITIEAKLEKKTTLSSEVIITITRYLI